MSKHKSVVSNNGTRATKTANFQWLEDKGFTYPQAEAVIKEASHAHVRKALEWAESATEEIRDDLIHSDNIEFHEAEQRAIRAMVFGLQGFFRRRENSRIVSPVEMPLEQLLLAVDDCFSILPPEIESEEALLSTLAGARIILELRLPS